jgi:2-desacetyl-2-hydroxyethyl bacteriochlorophyllide A dehydrogenase
MTDPANMMARAYWAIAPFKGEIRELALAPPGPGEALVRTLASGISLGTETLVAQGAVPQSEWQRMRCPFQEGQFPFPVKYGYAAVGTVVAGPAHLLGRRVFCLHPHQTAFVVPAAALTPLPEALPTNRAVLAANQETALNAVWDAGILPGDRIVVIGAGVVGALIARLAAAIPGTEVTLVDHDPAKAGLARRLGLGFSAPGEAPGEADILIEATGQPAALETALASAGFEARVVIVSWYGERTAPVALGGVFHSRRLRLLSSQVGALPAARRARWDHRRRLAKAMELLSDPALDTLISGESTFAELPNLLPELAREPAGTLCHRITYDEEQEGDVHRSGA